MVKARPSNIPEPVRSHLDRANGLIECVDKNLTYRTERALRCGNDVLQELAMACLIHRGIDFSDNLQEQFIKQLDVEALRAYEIIKAGLLDFGMNPPLHPLKCSKEELQQEIERDYRLAQALRRLWGWVDDEMDVYLPCRPSDFLLTGFGVGCVLFVAGSTVHTFVPERWEWANPFESFVSLPAIYRTVNPIPKPDDMPITIPSYYFLRDGWKWFNSSLGLLDDGPQCWGGFVKHARSAVMFAALAWVSEQKVWMAELQYPNPERIRESLAINKAGREIILPVQSAFDVIQEFETAVEGVASLQGELPSSEDVSHKIKCVFDVISDRYNHLISIEPDDLVEWDDVGIEEKYGKVVWRSGAAVKVATEVETLDIYTAAVRLVKESAILQRTGRLQENQRGEPILGIEMPDYTTRRDAFDAVLKPYVPFPDGYAIDWNNPERFACDCCGFPMIINPGSYEMCTLCDWEGENYPVDTNYGCGPNGGYMLFDARKNFELSGCMFVHEDEFDNFERATKPEILSAKRKLIRACLDFLNIKKDTPEWFQAWEQILRLEIDLINIQQGPQVDFDEVSNRLRRRAYPVAVGQPDGRYYCAVVPDFSGCLVEGCFSQDDAVKKVRTAMLWHIQHLREKGQNISEPTIMEVHENKPEFSGWAWILIEVNHHGI